MVGGGLRVSFWRLGRFVLLELCWVERISRHWVMEASESLLHLEFALSSATRWHLWIWEGFS